MAVGARRDRPRVLLYADVDAVGGAEIAMGNLLSALDDAYEVWVAGTDERFVRWLARRGRQVPWAVVGPGPLAHLRMLRRIRPHVVHVNLEVPWAAPTMLACALAQPGLRVVAVEHMAARTVHLGTLLRTRALLLRLDQHVAVSADAAKRVEDFYALGRGSVRVIHNGVPPAPALGRAAARGERGLVIGSVGRLDRVKGHDVLLEAVARLPETRVVIVGAGPEEEALRQRARALGIADRVSLAGWSDRVADRLAEFDIYCHPSRYEGLGLALLEAMRAGLPCVASAVGGVPELLDHGRYGVLVPPENPEALAAALGALAADPGRRARLGAQARARVLAEFTTERMAAAYRELWAETLRAPRAPRLRPRPPKP
ncbi:MAG TPA: glycosyltransferase [Micromonospora sp.]